MFTRSLRCPPRFLLLCLSLILCSCSPLTWSPATLRVQPVGSQARADLYCPPLPMAGNPVYVGSVAELEQAVNNASPGDTILLADGTYNLDGAYLRLDVPQVTLRSQSGDRQAVVLEGNYLTTEIVQIAASNVTVADLTLRRAYDHPIHVMSDGEDTLDTLLYNLHIIDPGQQAIKVNPAQGGVYPDQGEIACSHIELTDAGRSQIRDNCYTGGIDAHQAWGWVIRDNRIEGFWCPTGLSEHAIHLWRGSRDTVVERNVLWNNARGVGLGMDEWSDSGRTYPDDPCPSAEGGYVDHYGGIVRNNAIFVGDEQLFASEYGFDCGICLWQACGAWTVHNTVASTQPPFSAIEWRFDHSDVDLVNNLVTHNLRDRGGTARLAANLEDQPLSLFQDGPGGDLHLLSTAAAAIDQGAALAAGLCDDDLDGDLRPSGGGRDIGVDEYLPDAPAAVADLQVTQGVTASGTLTATLRWTAPAEAVTYTIRYADTPLDEENWSAAPEVPVPFAASPPGTIETLVAVVPYGGGTRFFALRSQSAGGVTSPLSNNALWPHRDLYLPFVAK